MANNDVIGKNNWEKHGFSLMDQRMVGWLDKKGLQIKIKNNLSKKDKKCYPREFLGSKFQITFQFVPKRSVKTLKIRGSF